MRAVKVSEITPSLLGLRSDSDGKQSFAFPLHTSVTTFGQMLPHAKCIRRPNRLGSHIPSFDSTTVRTEPRKRAMTLAKTVLATWASDCSSDQFAQAYLLSKKCRTPEAQVKLSETQRLIHRLQGATLGEMVSRVKQQVAVFNANKHPLMHCRVALPSIVSLCNGNPRQSIIPSLVVQQHLDQSQNVNVNGNEQAKSSNCSGTMKRLAQPSGQRIASSLDPDSSSPVQRNGLALSVT